MAMDALNELVSQLEAYANSEKDFYWSNIENWHSVYGGDHGVSKFCFGSKLITTMKDNIKNYAVIYPLTDGDGKKASSECLKRLPFSIQGKYNHS